MKPINIISKLNEHNDVVARQIDSGSSYVKDFVDLFKKEKPDCKIKDCYLIIEEGGWEPSTAVLDTDGGFYKVNIPNDNDGSVASYMGYKRSSSVSYIGSTKEDVSKKLDIDYFD